MKRPSGTKVVIDEPLPGRWKVLLPGRPAPFFMFASMFLLCWMAGLAVGATFALRFLAEKKGEFQWDLGLILWSAGWIASGVAAMAGLRRCLEACFGSDGLILRPDRVTFARILWGMSRERDIEFRRVTRFVRRGRGLRMEFGGRAISFGYTLTSEEALWLEIELQKILERMRTEGGMDRIS